MTLGYGAKDIYKNQRFTIQQRNMLCNPNTNKQWKLKYYYYHVTYFAIVNCITAQILDPVTQEEIFGSGQSSKNNQVINMLLVNIVKDDSD